MEVCMSDEEQPKQKKFPNITSSGGFKIAMLIILILLLLIPITMIRSLVIERSHRAADAERSIMEAWGSEFELYGPIIRIPIIEGVHRTTNKFLWITPKEVNIQADFSAEKKRRGIFSVALFSGDVSLTGSFTFERVRGELKESQELYPQQAEIIIGLTNPKSLRKIIKADWNGSELFFRPGNRNFSFNYLSSNGINASSPFDMEGENTFDIQISIQGGKSLRTLPIGELTRTSVRSDWPSPSFQGASLPITYTLSESGFEAEWEVSYLSRSIPLFWVTGERGEYDSYDGRANLQDELFGVNFFKPLDHYALNERAVKYAILFLIIPFLTLFFLEVFSQKSIHPVQYLLSGLANVIFYLLLLSISEHFSFSVAYLIAAVALTAMMSLYARSLLESWAGSVYMGIVMASLYLILYLTLNAEDWALLIGSIVAFLICGVVMFLTRKLDWKNLNIKT
jgi:inner membrane protein